MLKKGCKVLKRNHRTVAVGMSGGVDSTVAALLLKKEVNAANLTLCIYSNDSDNLSSNA